MAFLKPAPSTWSCRTILVRIEWFSLPRAAPKKMTELELGVSIPASFYSFFPSSITFTLFPNCPHLPSVSHHISSGRHACQQWLDRKPKTDNLQPKPPFFIKGLLLFYAISAVNANNGFVIDFFSTVFANHFYSS